MSLEVATGVTSGQIQANRAAAFSTHLLLLEASAQARSQVCSCCVFPEVSHTLPQDRAKPKEGELPVGTPLPVHRQARRCTRQHQTAFRQDTFLESPASTQDTNVVYCDPQTLHESQRGPHTTSQVLPGLLWPWHMQDARSRLCSGSHTVPLSRGGEATGSLKARRGLTTSARKQKYPASKQASDL